MSDVVCFYHAGCADGWCAAWIVNNAHPGAHLVPVKYGEGLPAEKLYADKDVFVVDFSYPPDLFTAMAEKAKSVVMLDHHASAIERWKGVDHTGIPTVHVTFDVRHSGAKLAWNHLLPHTPTPPLVQYVQDRDLWKWELPDSHAVNAYIRTQPMTVDVWDELNDALAHDLIGAVHSGESILQRERQIIDKAVRNAVDRDVAGFVVPVVNTTEMHSEIGNELCKGKPFAAMYQDDLKRNKRVWSLRSCEGGEDVSMIAMQFGGGGHKHAAGFVADLN